jgi:hypothetical protein
VFVRLVASAGNQTQAYLDAGYKCTRTTAAANAARLLGKARVKRALARLTDKRLEELEQAGDEELRLAGELMRFSILDLFKPNGKAIPLHKLPRHVAAGIKGIRPTDHGLVLTFHDKMAPIELRLKAFGRLVNKHEHDLAPKTLAELVTEAAKHRMDPP